MSERIHMDTTVIRANQDPNLVMYTTVRRDETVKAKCGTRGGKLFLTTDPTRVTCLRCS